MLTPCWPSAGPTGGAGVAFPAGICSLIVSGDLLCHVDPAPAHSFSTCRKSSSTGVDRPKIVTITFSVLRSRLTSSTTPGEVRERAVDDAHGSPCSNVYFGFGFSFAVTHLVEDLVDLLLR